MRVTALFMIFLSGLCYSQDVLQRFGSTTKTSSNQPYIMVKKSESAGLEIIRRVSTEYVIVRRPANSRSENLEVIEVNNEWKWAEIYDGDKKETYYVSTVENPEPFIQKIKFISFDDSKKLAVIEGTPRAIRKELLSNPNVTFIQLKSRTASVESLLREHNLGLNNIRYVQSNYPSVNGSDIRVSIKEQSFDTLDIDIYGRSTRDDLSNSFVVGHATDMATLVAGAGNSYISGHGVAPGSNLFSESYDNLFPATTTNFTSREITIQNHSYGVGVENFYGLESVAFDNQAGELPDLVHIFSSGNSGSQQGNGQYIGLNRYGTLTGSFKQAKNVILATSSDEFGNILPANSAGPAYDGRIKPDISAFGKGGTSDAAAVVSGSVSLLQQHYLVQNSTLPSTEAIKALLIAGSDDIGNPGPDFYGGYGQLNLKKSMEIIENIWTLDGVLADQEIQSLQITLTEPAIQMTIVLAWRDPAANSGDALALVNDLDLKASLNSNEWLPWILDSSPTINALSTPATTGADHLNNVEVIRIDNPTLDTYTIDVSGFDITGSQEYVIAYYIEQANDFVWTYPTAMDPQEAGTEINVYFDNSFGIAGTLEWGDLSNSWTAIGTIDPGSKFTSFTIPEVNEEIVLRTTFGPDEFKSDTFHVGIKPQLKVALYCDDELVLNWDKIAGANNYELRAYENGVLVSKQMSMDTFAIVNRSEIASLLFTVRQVGEYSYGLPDETVRVDQQGIGCYLNNFLATLDIFEVVNLTVSVSLPEFIETLRIIKTDMNDSIVFKEIAPTQTEFSFIDSNLTPGQTSYFVQLITKNGAEIISDKLSLFTTDDKKYILFPNPVTDGSIYLLSPEPHAVFQILQLDGKPLNEFIMTEKFAYFELDLTKGTYLYRVLKGGKVLKSGKFVVGS